MKKTMLAALFCLFCLAAIVPLAFARRWTSNDGRYSVEAEVVERSADKVTLRKQDGMLISVAIQRLSDADREFLARLPRTGSEPASTRELPTVYLTRLRLIERQRFSVQNDANSVTTFTILQVALVPNKEGRVLYKVGYQMGNGGANFEILRFGSCWLELKSENEQWTWNVCKYLNESAFSRTQLQPPHGVISEDEADKAGMFLTRKTLRKAGITP